MRITKVRDVKTPQRGTVQSAGLDFFIPNDYPGGSIRLAPGEACFIPSGIKVKVPTGYSLIAFNKSGIAVKKNLHVGAAVVDEDYQGEIHINLTNVGTNEVVLHPGDKIVQFILLPVLYAQVEIVEEKDLFTNITERGAGGFGSTGEK